VEKRSFYFDFNCIGLSGVKLTCEDLNNILRWYWASDGNQNWCKQDYTL